YATNARIPEREARANLSILHPRVLTIPKVGMSLAPVLLYASSLRLLRRLRAQEDFDLIDAHYFYPDGVAAVLLGAALGKPVVITARGTDVNLIPNYTLPRCMIRYAAARAAHIITVSQALKDALIALGVPTEKLTVLRNGVDLRIFHPASREEARRR